MAPQVLKQLVAVIDNRTTMICLRAAGQIRPVNEPFETLAGEIDMPPFHVHCRSIVVPYMSGFVNEIKAEANEEIKKRPLKQRKFGPEGYTGKIPPRAKTPTPSIDVSAVRSDLLAARGGLKKRLADVLDDIDPMEQETVLTAVAAVQPKKFDDLPGWLQRMLTRLEGVRRTRRKK